MAEKYYIVNPTQHALQIYDIIRILPGTEEEPTVTECIITSEADLQAIQGTEGWGLKVLSLTEYEEIMSNLEEDEEEDEPAPAPREKVKVSNQRKKEKSLPEPEEELTELTAKL